MHIQIETKVLQKILPIVSRVSTKHSTLPILQCVLLEVKKNTLSIKATNLEIGIEGIVDVTASEDGVVAVPAQILLQTIGLIPSSTTTLYTEGETLIVDTKTSKTEIKTLPTADFPSIPQVSGKSVKINAPLFTAAIQLTAPTASQSSIKPELGCVYIHQKKEHSLTFVATDSFRLLEKTIPQKQVTLHESILIPAKNALELSRVTDGIEGEIELLVSENQCALRAGEIYITSRLIHGTFPDYEQIIPKEYKTTISLLTSDLMQGLRKTSIFLNKFMQLTLIAGEGTLTLSSQSSDAGATTEALKATVDGEDLSLSFNQRYVQEGVGAIHDDSILLKCAGVGRPMVMENMHDKSLRYLVMPMNK